MTAITHIVPALPPAVNGLGDYAHVLARALEQNGVRSRFLVAGTERPNADGRAVGGFPVDRLGAPAAAALAQALERTGTATVLLHFSGYGYARRGLCFWLVDGLARWKAAAPGRRLVTMFHELYASGPPWRSSFWTSWPQRRIACALGALSDSMVCGYALIARRLRAWFPTRRVVVMPVFSNVGELQAPAPLGDRDGVAVVFGSRGWRSLVYRSPIVRTARVGWLGVERIQDIGPGVPDAPLPDGLPVEHLGVLPADGVSALMARARIGIAAYPRHVLAKSGILAAYHAHALLCVNLTDRGTICDDVVEGRHFSGLDTLRRGTFDQEAIAAAGHSWYRNHDLGATAALFAGMMREAVPA